MTTETATAEAFARSLRHRHGLDNLAGFIVGEIDLRAAGGPAHALHGKAARRGGRR